MLLFYHWNTDTDAYGPLAPGLTAWLPAPGGSASDLSPVVVPNAPDGELWWEHVVTGSGDTEESRSFNSMARTVTSHMVSTPQAPTAAAIKNAEIDRRSNQAITGGIPVQISTQQAILSYETADRDNWANWGIGDTLDPAEKFVVRLLTEVNGKDRLQLGNTSHLDAGKKAIRKHVNAATLALDIAKDDVQAILTNPMITDDQKVTNIEAIDVESYAWPSNTVPAP